PVSRSATDERHAGRAKETCMSEWIYHLPVPWMGSVVLLMTAILTWVIYAAVMRLTGEPPARGFKGVTPALLSPLGVVFGLLTAFLSVQVWNDSQRAVSEVSREASALRAVDLLAANFPKDVQTRLHALLVDYVKQAALEEWPAMARQSATLTL